jgi:predicted negative regulator of RcsB-dependent stress response
MPPEITTLLASVSPLTAVLGWLYWSERQDHKETKKQYSELVDRILNKAGVTDA